MAPSHIQSQPADASAMPRDLLNFQLYGDAWMVHFI
jgi:hypothetical protein